MKPSTKYKMKYNRGNYKRYEFNVRIDSKLCGIIDRYKREPNNNLSELVKSCLCQQMAIPFTELSEVIRHID